MGIVTSIIDALRRFGSPTQKTAIQRQDKQLEGKRVVGRRRSIARSELGSAERFTATIDPVPETIVALAGPELNAIARNSSLAEGFTEAFLGHGLGDSFLDDLDAAFGAWMRESDKKGYSDDDVIEITGAAFGEFCVRQLNMRWVRVTDEHGSALAVQGQGKDFRGFPYHSVSKRIRAGE